MNGRENIIYFDNNATTAIKPAVREAMLAVLELSPLNASSIHTRGREARKLVEEARKKIAKLVNAEKDTNVIFTSCGTEANNLAIKGIKNFNVVVSTVEHHSVLKSAVNCHIAPVDNNGIINLKSLEKVMRNAGGKCLVSVMLANNETGVIQPIKEITAMVHSLGGIVHTDAVQAVGKIKVDMQELGADMISVSGHKFGGPQGVGALIAKKSVPLSPIQAGGGQELGLRAGTENIAAVAGFGVAAELVKENIQAQEKIKEIRDYIETEIKNITPEAIIFGEKIARLPNTSCVSMPGVKAETQLIDFDLAGIAVSSGSACSSGKVTTSHVLEAMGVDKKDSEAAIRVSLGIDSSKKEAEKFVKIWKELYERAGKAKKAA